MHGTQIAAPPLVLAVNRHRVGKMTGLEPKSLWAQFNDEFENVEWRTGDLVQHVRTGHSFCACHAHIRRDTGKKHEDGTPQLSAYRHGLNLMPTSIVALDYDKTTQKLREIFEQDPFIHDYACLGYTTTSSTEEHERYRVIWSIPKPIQHAENYRALLDALTWKYSVDPGSKDVVKAYAGNHTGSFKYIESPDNRLPREIAKALIAEHEAYLATLEKHCSNLGEKSENEWTARDVSEMLSFIPARQKGDLPYDVWYRILMAVHDAFPNETGIDLIKSWTYYRGNEIEDRWRSFGKTRVTIATLIAMAMDRGYIPPGRRNKLVGRVISGAIRAR